MDEIGWEYEGEDAPYKEYIHHLIQRFEGEVALGWCHWTWAPYPLPRNSDLWNPQYASSQENYEALAKLRHQEDQWGYSMVHPDEDLRSVGNTTILKTRDGEDGHWHLNGGGISLAELFYEFVEHYTVAELMHWYYNAPKVLRKKEHSWGSPECRKASLQRWKTYGRPGHQSEEIDESRPASKRK